MAISAHVWLLVPKAVEAKSEHGIDGQLDDAFVFKVVNRAARDDVLNPSIILVARFAVFR